MSTRLGYGARVSGPAQLVGRPDFERSGEPEVNPFVDHSQIVQLECLRRGIWGAADLWGRVQTYK